MNLVSLGPLRARIVHLGPRTTEPPLTIVLLHGYGAPGDDLVGLAQELGAPSGSRIVFPEAPLALDGALGGGRAWWPIDMARIQVALLTGQIEGFLNEVPDGLVESRRAVIELLDVLERDLGARPERTVLGGFSQGAMLSLDVALRTERTLAGLVLLSGSLICASEWRPLMPQRRGMHVLQSHGSSDPILLFPIAEALRDLLREAGLDVDWVPFKGGHTIGLEVMDRLARFLGKITPP